MKGQNGTSTVGCKATGRHDSGQHSDSQRTALLLGILNPNDRIDSTDKSIKHYYKL